MGTLLDERVDNDGHATGGAQVRKGPLHRWWAWLV